MDFNADKKGISKKQQLFDFMQLLILKTSDPEEVINCSIHNIQGKHELVFADSEQENIWKKVA